MEKHILSKSTYIKGEQCLKQLYLSKKRPFLRDRLPAERLAIFSRGTNVGIYAQELFPNGIDAGPKHPSQYRKALVTTSELIVKGQKVIYEAAFQAHKTLILLDILVKNGDSWDAYEVKSSKALSETYYKDAALQYYVLTNAGIKINSFSLIHIDKDYIREDEIDIHKLFITTDVTEEVRKRQEQVQQKINEEINILEDKHSPKIAIGKHCFSPYDCDFIGHCWKSVKKPSVFDVPSIEISKKFEYLKNNKTLEEILTDKELSKTQSMQISCQINNSEYINIDKDLAEKLNTKNKYALKILGFAPALPQYPNTKPYQILAFGFAFMPLNGNNEGIKIFIADGKVNPNEEVIKKLKELSKDKLWINYDSYIPEIDGFDMQTLCLKGKYYNPAMKKNYSSKSLSKALGIKTKWKEIESDIVAAQYYDEIQRKHKDSNEKLYKIESFLKREVMLIQTFVNHLICNSQPN